MDDRFEQHLSPDALGAELAAALHDDGWHEFSAELIAGGKSNLTFRLVNGESSVILRRPPTGRLLPRAHDMAREARILRALADTPVPVPRVLHLGDENGALGLAYYVMEIVPGIVVRDQLPTDFATTTAERVAIAAALTDSLADLHAIDPSRVGLDGYGRPAGYFARQLARWADQFERSEGGDVPALATLRSRLEARLPPDGAPAIVHGDYRIDNCVLNDVDPGRINGVLDWELSTLGDPLADLGLLLFYWREPGEEPWSLAPAPTRAAGFPDRRWIVDRYAARTDVDPADVGFAHAFAHYKFAGITQGVAARVRAGAMAGQDFGDLSGEVARIADAGLAVLHDTR